uniref:Geminin n=1 Tax=Trichuris muris TaxID=70415 RepID=A0A5S6PYF9_TRIMR
MALRHVQTSPKGRNLVGTLHQSKENPTGGNVDVDQKNRIRGRLLEDGLKNIKQHGVCKNEASQTEADTMTRLVHSADVGVQTETMMISCSMNTVPIFSDQPEMQIEREFGNPFTSSGSNLVYWKLLAKESQKCVRVVCKENADLCREVAKMREEINELKQMADEGQVLRSLLEEAIVEHEARTDNE